MNARALWVIDVIGSLLFFVILSVRGPSLDIRILTSKVVKKTKYIMAVDPLTELDEAV